MLRWKSKITKNGVAYNEAFGDYYTSFQITHIQDGYQLKYKDVGTDHLVTKMFESVLDATNFAEHLEKQAYFHFSKHKRKK